MQLPRDIIPRIAHLIQSHRGHSFRAFLLCALFTAVYLATPHGRLSDGRFTLLLAEGLLVHHTTRLDQFLRQPPPEGHHLAAWSDAGNLLQRGNELYYLFPHGSAALSIPFVALTRFLGIKIIDDHGNYDEAAEEIVQSWLAALLGAGTVGAWFLAARRFAGERAALVLAVSGGVCTPLWSVYSRTLWADAWGVFLLSVLLALVAGDGRSLTMWRKAVVTLLVLALPLVKPLYALSSVLVLAGMVAQRRGTPAILVAAGLTGFGVAWFAAQPMLPFYYHLNRLAWSHAPEHLAGVLFSPGRGWFVYLPATVVLLAVVAARWRDVRSAWVVAALAAIAVHVAVVALFPRWWGGHGYGPRLLAASLPWWIVLAASACRVIAAQRAARACVAATLLAGAAIHARGALSDGPGRWNVEPIDVDRMPARAWDWRVPPFLADVVPDRLYPGVPLYMTAEGAESFLGDGWRTYGGPLPMTAAELRRLGYWVRGDFDRNWRWTEGSEASLRLHMADVRGRTLRFVVVPKIVPEGPVRQRVHILVGDREVGSTVLARLAPSRFSVHVPGDVRGRIAEVRLALPDAQGAGLFVLCVESGE